MATGTAAPAFGLRQPLDLPAALRESAIAAGICAVLTGLVVGIRTVESGGALTFVTDYTSVALVCLFAFLGRFGLVMNRQGRHVPVLIGGLVAALAAWLISMADLWPTPTLFVLAIGAGLWLALQAVLGIRRGRVVGPGRRLSERVSARMRGVERWVGPALVAFAVVIPFTPFGDRAMLGDAIIIMLYIMLGWGLNIIVGLAGLLDLGYVAFYAVGAYSYALLAQTFGWSFWVCLPLAGVFAASFGLLLGYPVLRLRGDYFAIVTLGFGEIIRIVLLNWVSLTGGPNGVNNVPRPSFFGLPFERNPEEGTESFHTFFGLDYDPMHRIIFLYFLILALALLVNVVSRRLRRLPIGRAWEALREDDVACQSLGIDRTRIKLAAFAISAMFGGFAGSFFATHQGFISPESFTFIESAIILAIVVLGGMGSQLGIVIAAFLIIGLPEIFRDLDLYRMLVFGLCMIGIMIWRPSGLLARREPTVLLARRRRAAATEHGA